jgi:glycosyltransferase involved in cell wall biosynthesis
MVPTFMELSVVIPVKNEADNVAPLVKEICAALDDFIHYEIIFVDDGSKDSTADVVLRLLGEMPHLRLLRHAESWGQSAAIRTGVKAARAEWIATIDGDGQNDPADIRKLWQLSALSAGTAPIIINGHRRRRRDNWSKRFASRLANRVRRRLLRDDTPDSGCGLKLFPRSLFLDLPFFDHMHRFLPALVLREGGLVYSVPVNHRPRWRGVSKYGVFDRLGVGLVDLFGVMWLKRRAARPHLLDEPAPERKTASASQPKRMPR